MAEGGVFPSLRASKCHTWVPLSLQPFTRSWWLPSPVCTRHIPYLLQHMQSLAMVCGFIGLWCLRAASAPRRTRKANECGPPPSSSIASEPRLFSNSSRFTHIPPGVRCSSSNWLCWRITWALETQPPDPKANMESNAGKWQQNWTCGMVKHRYRPRCIMGTVFQGMLSISVLVKQDKMLSPPAPQTISSPPVTMNE